MALSIWTQRSGYRFATIQERDIVEIPLPVSYSEGFNDSTVITFTVISGKLPPGLRIYEDKIIGTAFEVSRSTDFEFVIRASYGGLIADRTFFISVEGSDPPTWETAAGSLAVVNPGQYYVLDSSYIDFQLLATDFDTAAGQTLKYFLSESKGELPPGLILTETGRIVGWIQPLLAVPETVGSGAYDTTIFDTIAFDFGTRSSNGYDSYVYDITTFDYSIPDRRPRKLNRYYEFEVTVTDGDSSATRIFKIYVVGDDYFRADTTSISAGTGAYTVDTTYVRKPIWVTDSNLGIRRANNYQTFKLDTYEGLDLGPITYRLNSVNPKIYGTGYTTSSQENKIGKNKIRFKKASGVPSVGQKITLEGYVSGAGTTVYTITNITTVSSTEYLVTIYPNLSIGIPNNTFIEFGDLSELPPGVQFDPGSGEVFGVVPYQPAITTSYAFTVVATRLSDNLETASSYRTFYLDIIGDIDSVITWNSDSHLGTIDANLISSLSVSASTTLTGSTIIYLLESGSLPPGLTLSLDGEIIGKVNQFGSLGNPGLITFDNNTLTFDDGSTTIDRDYIFTIQAKDIAGYSAVSKTFTISIGTPNDRLYSTLVVKPFLKQNQRDLFKSFITDSNIFTPGAIYRPEDPNFGIQNDLRMIVYAGIETKSAAEVVGVINRNHKKKQFYFGNIKKAVAKNPGTNTVVYEVIYIEIKDPLEINGVSLPAMIKTSANNQPITVDQNNQYDKGPFTLDTKYWKRPEPFNVTLDRNDVFVSDPYNEHVFPSSVSLWRKRIKELGIKERNYLPLWMRSIQPGEVEELDYVMAVPLCYCKPGYGDDILLNIQNKLFVGTRGTWLATKSYLAGDTVIHESVKYTCLANNSNKNPKLNSSYWSANFNFDQLDFVIDRYIIDSVTGYAADKYIVFRNDRTTVT